MPRRSILTDRQRAALFDLPTDDASMLRHYTLADDDLEIIHARRRPHNRFGFALQLCALRYPGRLLAPGEVIPLPVTRFLAAQLGIRPDDLAGYAAREETRHEHLAILRDIYGYKMFAGRGARDLKIWLEGAAETARSNEDMARRFVEQCRAAQTILPGITVIERLCADALVAAERRVDARIAGRLDDDMRTRLDALLTDAGSGALDGVNMWFATTPEAEWGYHDMTESWITTLNGAGYQPVVVDYSGFNGRPASKYHYLYDLMKEMLIFHSENFGD